MARHLISIPVTNTWLFWVAPLVGAVLAGVTYRWLSKDDPAPVDVSGKA